MAKMNTKFKYQFDAAPSITLEAKDAPARTEDGVTNALELDQLDGYWNPGNNPADQTFAVVVNVEQLALIGVESYELAVEFGDDANFTNSVTTHNFVVNDVCQLAALVDVDTVINMLPEAKFVRLALTVDAGTGIAQIDFAAFIGGAIIR